MRRRWRLDIDWELAVILIWAAWGALGIMAIVVTGAIFNDKAATNLAGAITMFGVVGIPLLAGLLYGVHALRGRRLIRREWESGPDLREHYRR